MNKKPVLLIFFLLSIGALFFAACGGSAIEGSEDEVFEENKPGDSQLNSGVDDSEGDTISRAESVELLGDQDAPPRAEREFTTDFSIHSIDYDEVLSGGPPKDGIPAVDDPKFVSVKEAEEWLDDLEPVVSVTHNGETRAYPIQILMWHEIVNDNLGGEPVSVTFCPLCNTAIVFSGVFDNLELDFGTTGRLRYSNLIMYDRQTETWWQQATGQGIAGDLTGSQLTFLPASMVSWQQFKESYPDAEVLSRDTGYSRSYGRNPYVGYDNILNSPFLYYGPETPGELPATARVLTLDINGEAVAYPYDVIDEVGVVNDTVGGEKIVVFWQPGVASPFDRSDIASGKDVGAAAAFSRVLNGEVLTFSFVDGEIVDDQTGSVWNVLGEGVSGDLKGESLTQIISINHFWFSWAAFRPETRIYTGG